jgi:16S rRNA (cytosine967-C5)-methyltransferase
MTLKSLLSHSIEAYQAVRNARRPADVELSDYLRARKYLGSHDRKFISETVYGALRLDLSLEPFAQRALAQIPLPDKAFSGEFLFALVIFLFLAKSATPNLIGAFSELSNLSAELLLELQSSFLEADGREQSPSLKFAFPEWVVVKLSLDFPADELAALLHALNSPAPLALRANTLLISRDDLQKKLAQEQIPASPGALSPDALICDGRRPIFQSQSFKNGLCEIQDEGSQLISILLNPKPKTIVLDACAGGGGKTLHLAALMQNKGKVYAYDKFPKRLGNIRERIKRSGLQNIDLLDSDEKLERFQKNYAEQVDFILIDAPCTGSGTIRRNPDLKRRLTPESLESLVKIQSEILGDFAPLLKPNGKMVYATCSIFSDENEAQIAGFLSRRSDFALLPLRDALQEIRISADLTALQRRLETETYLKLFPHRDNTDGFFAAVLRRL